MSMTGAGVWVQAGREFTAAEVEHIRETVAWLPRLDRTELAATLCEHLGWYSASGTPKLQACAKLLEKLQSQALIRLPAWRLEKVRRGAREAPTLSERTDAAAPLRGALRDIAPVRVEPVREPAEEGLWNEYVARYAVAPGPIIQGRAIHRPPPHVEISCNVRMSGQIFP